MSTEFRTEIFKIQNLFEHKLALAHWHSSQAEVTRIMQELWETVVEQALLATLVLSNAVFNL